MVSICSLFHCLRGIFDLLPPLAGIWDYLVHMNHVYVVKVLYVLAFCGTTKFLSTLAISGSSSLSWASHASMIVLNGRVDFWIINLSRICNCVSFWLGILLCHV